MYDYFNFNLGQIYLVYYFQKGNLSKNRMVNNVDRFRLNGKYIITSESTTFVEVIL